MHYYIVCLICKTVILKSPQARDDPILFFHRTENLLFKLNCKYSFISTISSEIYFALVAKGSIFFILFRFECLYCKVLRNTLFTIQIQQIHI